MDELDAGNQEAVAQPRLCPPTGAEEQALLGMVRTQLERGSPPRFEWPQVPAVERRWEPRFSSAEPRARIVAARPELGIENVKSLAPSKINRSAREGWRGRAYSFKAGSIIHWNGRLVEAAILEADADARVSRLIGSPLTLEYLTPLGWRTKSPDFLVIRNGSPWLIECVWERTASRPGQAERWQLIGKGCASLGLGFEVFTELHLERRPRARNVQAICRARCDPPSEPTVLRAVIEMIERENASVNDCVSRLGINRRLIYRMILEGFIGADLDNNLDRTPLFLAPERQS